MHMSPTQIASTLPAGKSYELALAIATRHKERIWNSPDWMREPEDHRIAELERICSSLCCGDAQAAKSLASDAIWNPWVAPQ